MFSRNEARWTKQREVEKKLSRTVSITHWVKENERNSEESKPNK